GDVLFFMRFAPLAAARGARLVFRGDARLAPLLLRARAVEQAIDARAEPARDASRLVWVGDLPAMLGTREEFSPPLALIADEAKRARVLEGLTRLGPRPWVGLTWRAGLPRRGKAVLSKEVPLEALGAALASWQGTFVSVQRNPQPGEMQRLA